MDLLRLRAVSLFFLSLSSETREIKKKVSTRVTEVVRQERYEKQESRFLSLAASPRALPSLFKSEDKERRLADYNLL